MLVLQNIDNAGMGSVYYCDVSFQITPIKEYLEKTSTKSQ